LEPVRVACPNCHGKLVVRSELLLGQTVVCPRCKSDVSLPTLASMSNSSEKSPVSYDSSAITRVDDGQLAQRIAEEISTKESLLDVDGQAFESAIQAFRPHENSDSTSSASASRSDDRMLDQPLALETLPHDDHPITASLNDWNVPETRRKRQILLVVMAGLGATILALAGLFAFLSLAAKDASVAQVPPAIESPQADPAIPANDSVPPQDQKSDGRNDTKEVSDTAASDPLQNPPKVVDGSDDGKQLPDSSQIPDSLTEAMQTKDIANLIPDARIVPTDQQKSKDANNQEMFDSLDMPESMKRFSQVFDPGSLSLLPDSFGKELNNGGDGGAEKIDIEMLYHPAAVVYPNWEKTQEFVIPRLATKDTFPLSELLIILGQLSNCGLGWDYESTRLSNLDTDTPVSISVEAMSMGEIVAKLCDEHRLALAFDSQGQPLLRPIPAWIKEGLPSDWSISDLATDATSLEEWNRILEVFFPSIGDRWKFQGDTLQWSDASTPIQQATVAAFLDQARTAFSLKAKSTLPASLLDPRLGLETSHVSLSKQGASIIEQAMSLPQLLDRAARDVGMKLVFDWKSVSAHGLSHAKSATHLLRGRNFPEVARWGLDEFALVAVVDGSDTVVITTLPQQRRMWRTLFLKLDAGKTVESVRESLRLLSPTDEQGRSTLLVSALPKLGEAPDAWVVVRICAPNVEQLQSRAVRDSLQLPPLRIAR